MSKCVSLKVVNKLYRILHEDTSSKLLEKSTDIPHLANFVSYDAGVKYCNLVDLYLG